MIQEVKYNGYTTQPSGYDAPDGTLDACINIINEDGNTKPLFQPKNTFSLIDGEEIMFIHETAVFKHYVLRSGTDFVWIDANDRLYSRHIIYKNGDQHLSILNPQRVTAVGNTLCILGSEGIFYLLWKPDDSNYLYLGEKPEMIELSFGLSENKLYDYIGNQYSQPAHASNYAIGYFEHVYAVNFAINDSEGRGYVNNKIAEDEITTVFWATVNKANAEIAKQGRFYAPFFVRYCYRLYDNTMFMQSAPVFMPVSMPVSYNAFIPQAYVNDNNEIRFNVVSPDEPLGMVYLPQNVALTFKIISGSINTLKEQWNDIVKSIDIFVSLPITREDDSENIRSIFRSNLVKCFNLNVAYLKEQDYKTKTEGSQPQGEGKVVLFDVPKLSDEAYLDKIHSVANFYKVASYNLDEDEFPTSNYEEVNIDKTVLPMLATQEVMTDDYNSHNSIMPLFENYTDCITTFTTINKRLFVSSVKEKLFDGFKMDCMLPRCSAVLADGYDNIHDNEYVKKVYVVIASEQGTKCVSVVNNNTYNNFLLMKNCPLFYPNNMAEKMIVECGVFGNPSLTNYYQLKMKSSPMLNGAITIGGILDSVDSNITTYGSQPPDVINEIIYANKLYTSVALNPFVFPSRDIDTIGGGTILGLATVNKPVSTGQFGYSDIYIFTSEGVWVAKIQKDGSLNDINPVSQDVCTNRDSITQLDSSVLFATDRGIMQIQGSEAVCISDIVAAPQDFPMADLPQINILLSFLDHTDRSCLNPAPFQEFINGCQIIYDYLHQRVVIFNPATDMEMPDVSLQLGGVVPVIITVPRYSYAYVFSLKSKLWGMMYSNFKYKINSYPDALAVTHNNDVVSFSDYESTQDAKQFLITRPLKLGDRNVYKTITTLIQRGYFVNGRIKTVVWGSNDLHRWYLIGSSVNHELRNIHGTGYKYFRFAAIGTLGDREALSGASVEFMTRYTNNLH